MANPTLLLADDSVTIRRVIELTFADENITVVAVGDGDEAIARIEDQGVHRPLCARAVRRGVRFERELEEGVELHRRTAAQRILDDEATAGNVSGPTEVPRAAARGEGTQHPQIPIA